MTATLNSRQTALSDDKDWHQIHASTLCSFTATRSSRTAPEFKASTCQAPSTSQYTVCAAGCCMTKSNLLAGPEVFRNQPKTVRAPRKMSFTEWLRRCQLAELWEQKRRVPMQLSSSGQALHRHTHTRTHTHTPTIHILLQ